MTKTKTTFTALLLLAVATLLPACELNRECNPQVELCVYSGHPGGLAPRS
ncbi:hypothetical protein [Enhygromyxa salina]|uniref:Lipoprotein n=1 Tax=Enhygromyxa salina TaxID=215803 RepID=A0A2S9YWU9_9BACT|nr:hypothetical protein [Enhygromyxa salina]PRQ09581.1 hypothetical protein ENSA7_06380 [Enhygromyxa salina]